MKTKQYLLIIITVVMLSSIGCGGNGGGTGGGTNTTGGVGGTGIFSSGQITAKGSITVNGVKYETEDAQIFLDGTEVLDDSELKVGMIVEVDGEINDDGSTGTATVVNFDDSVEGPVTSIDPDTLVIEVLGQTVIIDAQTVFDNSSFSPADISGMAIGDVVEVSGQLDAQGNITASHIEKTSSPVFELTGLVSNRTASTFTINNLTVDYSSAILEDFSGGTIQNGDFVEVKGSAFDDVTTTLTATRVENKNQNFDDDLEIEIESFVTALTPNGFTLLTPSGPIDVVVDSATEYFGGTLADILVGTKVEVEGSIINGELMANKVKIKDNVRIEVAAAGADGSTLTVQLRQLSAITVSVSSSTELDDKRDTPTTSFSPDEFIESINTDDHLKIRGRLAGNGMVIASELEVDDPESDLDDVELRGPVDTTPTDTTFVQILGVEIDTSNTNQFFDRSDSLMSRTEFFNSLEAGTLVEANGELSADNEIDADEMELED